MVFEYPRIPLIGEWRTWTGEGKVEVWKVVDKGEFRTRLTTPRGDCYIDVRVGGYHLVDYNTDDDWLIKITSRDVFEGNHAENSRIKIYGERIRP